MTSETKNKKERSKRSSGKVTTLQDVAIQAEVSTATVSRYLGNPDSVRVTRRNRIEKAINELNYIPHGAAQALASQKTRIIGAIVPTLHNAIFAQGLQYFQKRLQDEGYTLLVSTSDYSADEELTQAEQLMTRGVDAMLLVGLSHKPRLHERIKLKGIPYISTWSFDKNYQYPCIGFKNFEAAQKMTEYLLELGHRNFAVVPGLSDNNDRAADRREGTLTTLSKNGIHVPANRIVECAYDIGSARKTIREILKDAKDRPTAIICGNDVIAYGALFEAQNMGLKVPEDISVIGFDDLETSSEFIPALTTMQVPFDEMGERAADYLLARLNGEEVEDHIELDVTLIARESTAVAPKS